MKKMSKTLTWVQMHHNDFGFQQFKPHTVKNTSIRHFEQCNQQLSNLICQNYDEGITILLDEENQQHAV